MSDGSAQPERRSYLPDDPRRHEMLDDLGLPNVSLYRRQDLLDLRVAVKNGRLPEATLSRLAREIAILIEDEKSKGRLKVSAFKALVELQRLMIASELKIHNADKPAEAAQPGSVTNQQINIYMPANGREAALENGTNRR